MATTTYRGTVVIKADSVYAVIPAYGVNNAIGPCDVAGVPVDGDPCLVVLDDKSRPWLITDDRAQSIPAGGTTGQALVKHSNADWDTEWVTGGSGGAIVLDPWHLVGNAGEPAFQNSWVAGATVGFRKFPDGKVRLKGYATTGVTTAGTTIFTLPVGYRPVQEEIFSVVSNGVFGQLRVQPSGAVQIFAGTNYIAFDGVEFDTESVTSMANSAATPLDPFHQVGAVGEPAFTNGFSAQSGYTVRFRKDPFGKVKLSGAVHAPGAGGQLAAFTLPLGFRPSVNDRAFSCMANTGPVLGYVLADGSVMLPASVNYIYIDAIEFDAEVATAYNIGTGQQFAFIAVGTGTITAGAATTTKFGYANEVYDPQNCYSLSPDYAYVVPVTGAYEFEAGLALPGAGGLAANTRIYLSLFADGVTVMRNFDIQWSSATWSNDNYLKGSTGLVYLTAGQKMDVRINNSGAAFSVGGSSGISTYFTGYKVG